MNRLNKKNSGGIVNIEANRPVSASFIRFNRWNEDVVEEARVSSCARPAMWCGAITGILGPFSVLAGSIMVAYGSDEVANKGAWFFGAGIIAMVAGSCIFYKATKAQGRAAHLFGDGDDF